MGPTDIKKKRGILWNILCPWNWYRRGNIWKLVSVIPPWEWKKKNRISLHSEKVFDKIQDPFLVEILSNLQIKGNLLSLIEGNYVIPKPNTIVNGKRLNTFPLIHQTRQERLISPLVFNTDWRF